MAAVRCWRRCWVIVAVLCSVRDVAAVAVSTPDELFVENGTQARLSCTFKSSEVTSSSTSVSWSFQPESGGSAFSVFYYNNGKSYPGTDGPFKDRITWAGDLNKKDASIKIDNMQFKDYGTYVCDVKNPPDIVVPPKQIKLRVVEKVRDAAVDVSTPVELFVENGTQARLSCTFKSSEVTSSSTSVSWSFKPESGGSAFSVFYYNNGKSYPGTVGPFKDRITWAGDLDKNDASIKIDNMQFKDYGTYICDVKNPPDILVPPKQIKLRVVEKENLPFSNIPFWVGIICAVIGVLLLISIIIFAIVIYKKKHSKKTYSGAQ
ncbi:hypothetical protein FKM82_008020 [Ascaphus truei]|uniref:myelin protein zero-like protein 1 isoform X2 n=1 Tax=Ascaphus truei TaxID=8439 RepID=UPI003F59BB25